MLIAVGGKEVVLKGRGKAGIVFPKENVSVFCHCF